MFLAEIDTSTKERAKRRKRERGDAIPWPKRPASAEEKVEGRKRVDERERERKGERWRYTLQVRARVSRAANEPAAARSWLHGPSY